MSSIRLSPKHGVNPAIPKCFWCLEDKNMLYLPGQMKGDMEAPRNMVWDMEPCDNCKDLMDQGILLISVKNGEMEKEEEARQRAKAEYDRSYHSKKDKFHYIPNPYRTGGWAVIREESFTRIFQGPIVDQILSCRWSFVPDEVWDMIGLPREEA